MKIWEQGDVCNRRFHLFYPLAEGWWCVSCPLGFLLQFGGGSLWQRPRIHLIVCKDKSHYDNATLIRFE